MFLKLTTWVILILLVFLIVVFMPLVYSWHLERLNPLSPEWNTYFQQREKDCDICLSSFKVPCNATAGLNRECLDKYMEANSVCVQNCTMPLRS
jgi:hypothetical protein